MEKRNGRPPKEELYRIKGDLYESIVLWALIIDIILLIPHYWIIAPVIFDADTPQIFEFSLAATTFLTFLIFIAQSDLLRIYRRIKKMHEDTDTTVGSDDGRLVSGRKGHPGGPRPISIKSRSRETIITFKPAVYKSYVLLHIMLITALILYLIIRNPLHLHDDIPPYTAESIKESYNAFSICAVLSPLIAIIYLILSMFRTHIGVVVIGGRKVNLGNNPPNNDLGKNEDDGTNARESRQTQTGADRPESPGDVNVVIVETDTNGIEPFNPLNDEQTIDELMFHSASRPMGPLRIGEIIPDKRFLTTGPDSPNGKPLVRQDGLAKSISIRAELGRLGNVILLLVIAAIYLPAIFLFL